MLKVTQKLVLPKNSEDYDETSLFPVEGQELHIGNIKKGSQFHNRSSEGLDGEATVEDAWNQSPAAVRTGAFLWRSLHHLLLPFVKYKKLS